MIGYIKGYDICEVTKRKIEKKNFLDEMKVIQPAIKEELLQVLENKGIIYGLKKKNILKAVYLFEEKTEEDKEKEEEKNILVFRAAYHTEDTADKMEELEKAITGELKEKICLEEYAGVEWNDIEIKPRTISGNGFSGGLFSLFLCLGVMFGVIFDNISMGMLYGIAMGLCFGTVVTKKS